MRFTINGKDYDVTKADVERQMLHRKPQRIMRGRWSGAVRVNDAYYPVDQVLADALALDPTRDFNTATARHILRRLGFALHDNIGDE